jgi:pSer/pThr/pTyr-binding forkhead associated (FHA) protein
VLPTAAVTIAGRRHELEAERTVIGRSKDCDIQVSDPNVSRRHAEIRRDGGSYVLVDLDSTNGVEVNGKRVKRVDLSDGSRFTVGSTEVVFSEELA